MSLADTAASAAVGADVRADARFGVLVADGAVIQFEKDSNDSDDENDDDEDSDDEDDDDEDDDDDDSDDEYDDDKDDDDEDSDDDNETAVGTGTGVGADDSGHRNVDGDSRSVADNPPP